MNLRQLSPQPRTTRRAHMLLTELPEEQLTRVLSYLRAVDLCSVVESSKSLCGSAMVGRLVREILCLYIVHSQGKVLEDLSDVHTLHHLHLVETKYMMSLISGAEPTTGYWISKSWVSNARKHWEIQLIKRSKLSKRKARIRERRDSEVLPPWPDINADITCEHGKMASARNVRGKRRIIDKKSWKALSKYFPLSRGYKTCCAECDLCRASAELARQEQDERAAATRRERLSHLSSSFANALCARKGGVPVQCQRLIDSSTSRCPLVPGLYHLVPRAWLSAWRRFFKDPRSDNPGALDCTCLLCDAHGLLSVPVHVQEYMCGVRRNLLSNAHDGGGTLCEIVTAEEWDAISSNDYCDFTVRFTVDEDGGMQWSLEPCMRCDTSRSHDVSVRPRQRAWVQV